MPIDSNYYKRPGLYDKEAIFGIDDDAAQKCICDTIEEHDIPLMLQTDPTYGLRHQETIIRTVANALFENENLRTQIFPEWIFCIDDVMAYLKRNEVQPKLINEYIQLTITSYLQRINKTKLYLNDYIANRVSKSIAARLTEFNFVLRNQDVTLPPDSLKMKRKLIEDIEWEPSLYAYIFDYLKQLPCVNLFKKFIEQSGCKEINKKFEELIYEAFEYIEIKRECTQIVNTLKSIRETQKSQDRLFGPTYYHKRRIDMLSLGEPLGQNESEIGRKRVPTLQGLPAPADLPVKVSSSEDKDLELSERELFDVKTTEDPKPLAAVIEAGDEDWEETTIPQRGSINRRTGGSLNLSKTSGEIEPANPAPVKPVIAEQKPAEPTPADILSETADISLPRLPSYPGISAVSRAVDSHEQERVLEPASSDIDAQSKLSLKEKIAKIQGTVKSHPLIAVAGTVASLAAVLGTWVLTRPQQSSIKQEKKKVQLVEKISDAGVEEAMQAVAMHDASVSIDAMRAVLPPEIMQADMDFMAVKNVKPIKPVSPLQYKPTQTVVKKVDLSPKTDDSINLSSISLSSLKDLPEGKYRNMFAGESYTVDKATEGSITGFMQDSLLEMARKSSNQKEAVKAYYKMLVDLERGWLLYMQIMEENLKGKTNLSPKEAQQLKYWNKYKSSHAEKGCDAKFLYSRFNKLKEGSVEYKYYKERLDKAKDLMKGLEELNPDILDVNDPGNQKVVYAKEGNNGKVYVLKTFLDFASAMKLPLPKNYTGTTGEITPIKTTQPSQTFAEKSAQEKSSDSLSTINSFIEKLEKNAAEKEAKDQAQKDSTMNLLDRIVNSVESDAAKRESEKSAQVEKTDIFLDKMLTQIEENNYQRDLEKRSNWVTGDVFLSSSGTISTVNQPKAKEASVPNIPTVLLNDIAPIEQSGTINANNNDSRSQSGVIEKQFKSSGEIFTSESKNRLSKSVYGEIEKPKKEKKMEEKKSFFAGVKDKAKSLWGKLFS